ncbi:MAG: hypothetical protein JNL79_26760 [Myxococcales bacterium]|nr:hypothetical protein [Myxococcales bacterium]
MSASRDRLPRVRADQVPRTPSQRAVLRVLGTLLDADRVMPVVTAGLAAAGLAELPDRFDELLDHLVPHLVRELDDPARPWIVRTFVEDLEAEAEHDRLRGDPHSSARMAIATRVPERQPEPAFAPSGLQPVRVDEPASLAQLHAALEAPPVDAARRVVVVWNQDRFGRANLARILVRAGFDVVVLDEPAEVEAHLLDRLPCDVLLFDLDDEGSERVLGALAGHVELPLLVWTRESPAVVETRLARHGAVPRHAIVSRAAVRPAPLLEALDSLLG